MKGIIWENNESYLKMKDSKRRQEKKLEAMLQKMIEADAVLLEWSDELWLTLIDECIAHVDKTITFKFKTGYSITK